MSKKVDVPTVLAHKFPVETFSYTERDVILYALGIGAAADPLDPKELKFTYENDGDFSVIPSFGVTIPFATMGSLIGMPGLEFNPMMLLHGEQYMEVRKPLPTRATLTNHAQVSGVYDKGKGALVVLDVTTKDDAGDDVLFNQFSLFIRGIGGFGGDKGPRPPNYAPPQRAPDAVQREKTADNQALLYRLSGDLNPLHADPSMAAMGGFDKPILHGLCSFGYAARAVLRHFCDNDASLFKSIRVRFAKHVFPGETLITEMWKVDGNRIVFQVKAADRDAVVIANACVELHGTAASSHSSGGGDSGGTFMADQVFAVMKQQVSAAVVKKVNASFRFDVTNADGAKKSWLADLKSGDGDVRVVDPAQAKADCTIIIGDSDLVALMTGKLNPQQAFMGGKLKIKGNMMLAQKLQHLQPPKSKL